jgi:hypothetical protein
MSDAIKGLGNDGFNIFSEMARHQREGRKDATASASRQFDRAEDARASKFEMDQVDALIKDELQKTEVVAEVVGVAATIATAGVGLAVAVATAPTGVGVVGGGALAAGGASISAMFTAATAAATNGTISASISAAVGGALEGGVAALAEVPGAMMSAAVESASSALVTGNLTAVPAQVLQAGAQKVGEGALKGAVDAVPELASKVVEQGGEQLVEGGAKQVAESGAKQATESGAKQVAEPSELESLIKEVDPERLIDETNGKVQDLLEGHSNHLEKRSEAAQKDAATMGRVYSGAKGEARSAMGQVQAERAAEGELHRLQIDLARGNVAIGV